MNSSSLRDTQPGSAESGSVCRNCAGEGWVCENHEDRPWNAVAAFGCECGAGSPCPVCNRAMSCAPFTSAARFFVQIVENLVGHHEGESTDSLFRSLPNHVAWAVVNGRRTMEATAVLQTGAEGILRQQNEPQPSAVGGDNE